MIIFRYLIRQILASFFATTIVLLIIFVSNQFIRYLNQAASGQVTVHAVLLVTAIQIPMLLGYILSMSLFLAILLTLGRLYVDHEMVVLFSCGMSRVQIARIVMTLALAVTLVDAWLMLEVEPAMFRYRTEVILHSVETATLKKVIPGRFQTLSNDSQVLYVAKTDKHRHQFHDVFLAMRSQTQDPKTHSYKWDLLSSDSVAETTLPNNGNFFVFDNGYRYSGILGNRDFQVMRYDQYWARQPLPHVSLEGRYSAMPTKELLHRYAHDSLAVAEFQWRVVNSITTLVFALLAIPLSEVNPRKGKFAQILPGILIYVAYANMMFSGKSWIQDGKISTILGLWWVPAILLCVTLLLFRFKRAGS